MSNSITYGPSTVTIEDATGDGVSVGRDAFGFDFVIMTSGGKLVGLDQADAQALATFLTSVPVTMSAPMPATPDPEPASLGDRVAALIARLTEIAPERYSFTLDVGNGARKYWRIVMDNGSGSYGRSVHAFVDSATGDLLKAGGWKAPQRDKDGLAVRFNLLDDASFASALERADWAGAYLYKR